MSSDSPHHPILTEALSAAVAEVLGPFQFLHPLSHSYGINTVLALRSEDRGLVILKQYHQERRYHQERNFLARYTAVLGEHAPQITADLGAVNGAEPTILTRGLAGKIVDKAANLSEDELTAIYERTGTLLRQLHDQPFDDRDSVGAVEAVRARFASATAQAAEYDISQTDLERARGILGSAEIFEGLQRVPCHRDCSPRNWLYSSATAERPLQVHFIDFDMARPDFRVGDFLRIREEYTFEKPELWRAFLRGYGRAPSEVEEVQLRHLSIIWAMTTIIWARQFNDAPFEQTGRRILAARLEG